MNSNYRLEAWNIGKGLVVFAILAVLYITLFFVELALLILGFFVGLITNHHPRWMRLNLTREFYNNFWRYL